MALVGLCCCASSDGLPCSCSSIYALPDNAFVYHTHYNIYIDIPYTATHLFGVRLILQPAWMWMGEMGTHIVLMFLHYLLIHLCLLPPLLFSAALSSLTRAGARLQNAYRFGWVILHADIPCKLSLGNR